MRKRLANALMECLLVLIVATIGGTCLFLFVGASLAIIDAHHSPTIQDPYERQSEAK